MHNITMAGVMDLQACVSRSSSSSSSSSSVAADSDDGGFLSKLSKLCYYYLWPPPQQPSSAVNVCMNVMHACMHLCACTHTSACYLRVDLCVHTRSMASGSDTHNMHHTWGCPHRPKGSVASPARRTHHTVHECGLETLALLVPMVLTIIRCKRKKRTR